MQSHSAPFLTLVGGYFSTHFELLLANWAQAATDGTFFAADADLKHLMTVSTAGLLASRLSQIRLQG